MLPIPLLLSLAALLPVYTAGAGDTLLFEQQPAQNLPGSIATNGLLLISDNRQRSQKDDLSLEIPVAGSRQPRIIRVGPGRPYQLPSAAAKVAQAGDVVAVDAGTYQGDVAVWHQDNLRLQGVGGTAHLVVNGEAAERKAIWVIKGDQVTVENIEFSGARVPSRNGAGIRFEGSGLTLRNCYFHDNEMGVLTGKKPDSEILIEASEFYNNTVDYRRYGRLGHNIYIGAIKRFTLSNSYVHGAWIGHNVKSRAWENLILYNRITDENGGSSYLLDLPNGGEAQVVGNLFHQSRYNDNKTLVSFAAEKNWEKPGQALHVVNNTFVNDDQQGVFVNNHSMAAARLINNLFLGQGTPLTGLGVTINNLVAAPDSLKDPASYDYRLSAGAQAIDAGISPGRTKTGISLVPGYQYHHPRALEPRPRQGVLDVGAYEYPEEQGAREPSD